MINDISIYRKINIKEEGMRFELNFELKHLEIPKDNQSIWISFLKKAISNVNQGKYFERYFSGTNTKDYTFSIILVKPRFLGDKIQLAGNQIKMIFSADDRNKSGLIFFDAFIRQKHKVFYLPNGNELVLKNVNILRERLITSNKVLFRTMTGSGFVVREHNRETNKDKFYTVEDVGFKEEAKRVLTLQAKNAGFSDAIAENIIITPIRCKKILAKQYGIYVDATIGIIQIEADEDLLQYFYQAGAGSRSSAFGMLDIVAQG